LLPRLLLDTHIVVRWLIDDRKLSRERLRVLQSAVRRTQPVGLSAMSLLEIAVLTGQGKVRLKSSLNELFEILQGNPVFAVLPLTYEVASEAALLGNLGDPADRTIVATARVNRLSLVTSDQRIIKSKLVPVIA